MMKNNLLIGGHRSLTATLDSDTLKLVASDGEKAPNGPFTFRVTDKSGNSTDTTGLEFNSENEMSISVKGIGGTFVIIYRNL